MRVVLGVCGGQLDQVFRGESRTFSHKVLLLVCVEETRLWGTNILYIGMRKLTGLR